MSWIQKTLSIFGWKKNDNSTLTVEQKVEKEKEIKTLQDLKEWFEQELPPLAWQRVNLRIAKFALQNYGISLSKGNDDFLLPKELLNKINQVVKELFNKEIPNGN